MVLVITCKRPHSIIPHSFLTVSKCLTACQLKMTMKCEFSSNFPLTWSLKFGCLFQVIWYFAMKPFVKHYLEDYRIGKIPPDSMSYTLSQQKRMIWKNTKLALIAMGFQQFYEFQNTVLSLDLDPGSQGKPVNSWCVSFETECMSDIGTLVAFLNATSYLLGVSWGCHTFSPRKSAIFSSLKIAVPPPSPFYLYSLNSPTNRCWRII